MFSPHPPFKNCTYCSSFQSKSIICIPQIQKTKQETLKRSFNPSVRRQDLKRTKSPEVCWGTKAFIPTLTLHFSRRNSCYSMFASCKSVFPKRKWCPRNAAVKITALNVKPEHGLPRRHFGTRSAILKQRGRRTEMNRFLRTRHASLNDGTVRVTGKILNVFWLWYTITELENANGP